MHHEQIASTIARELNIKPFQVEATIKLFDDGNTIPFVARYRKEATGELDEEQLRTIMERLTYLRNLTNRQQEIIKSIAEQDKLTPALQQAIEATTKLQDLEDLYLPYRPKKRTRAQIAREKGLDPLAQLILAQNIHTGNPLEIAAQYINQENDIPDAQAAIAAASDIIAEDVSERAPIRALLRKQLWQTAELSTELVDEIQGQAYLMYKEYSEPISRMPSHRILAINRGEKQEMLKVHLVTKHEHNIDLIAKKVITSSIFDEIILAAITDGYKRLLLPSLEREIRTQLTANAEEQAIHVFGRNLRQLILQAPLSGYTIMGLDPGYRTGCKMAVVSPTGATLSTNAVYITGSDLQREKAEHILLENINQHGVSLISIGNGTASYETEEFVANLIAKHNLEVHYLITNEAGASVYSASKLAKEELPNLDVSLRGAVSIARRIQDPLAELVKIDPKSIGVGQYQHDVNQKELSNALTTVVESCVNYVGVELNTASAALLTHVSGINASVAKNIIAYRDTQGAFSSRKELLKVSRLGQSTFTQCAGFLKIQSSNNPLDNTIIHPESYDLAAKILTHLGFTLADLQNKERLQLIQAATHQQDSAKLASAVDGGEPTVRDILAALAKPGRDPREDLPLPLTRKNIVKLSDIAPGTIVKGTVHNVTDFGVFVDFGIKTNGLIHRSELSTKYFKHPLDVVAVGDIIDCMVLSVDEQRGRIALSLKKMEQNKKNH